jgi:hypothetical protein
MADGRFIKGQKKPNQGKRGPSKTTLQAREAISKLVDGNAHRLEGWLDEIAAKDPQRAWECFMSVVEYHIPKLARTEQTGEGGGPIKQIIQWKK